MPESPRQFLFRRIDYERRAPRKTAADQLGLASMRALAERLGHPERRFPIVHVAGTKGKGSTCSMIASILQAAGFRTGLYTSPHLERLEERFLIDGEAIPPDELDRLLTHMRPIIEDFDAAYQVESAQAEVAQAEVAQGHRPAPLPPTFFEITTGLAFQYFAESQVDVGVIEVGLGGRLDSTNICLPAVSVITTIGMDHMAVLGNTLALIAAEKAGIIKPQVPVVSCEIVPEAAEVIAAIAAERGSQLWRREQDFGARAINSLARSSSEPHNAAGAEPGAASATEPGAAGRAEPPASQPDNSAVAPAPATAPASNSSHPTPFRPEQRFDFWFTPVRADLDENRPAEAERELEGVELSLLGAHQCANAATAIMTCEVLRQQAWQIPAAAIREGLRSCAVPGRIERDPRDPRIIVDIAHNVPSLEALLRTVDTFIDDAPRTLLLSISKDKDLAGMAALLPAFFDRIIVTRFRNNPRAATVEQLETLIRAALDKTPQPRLASSQLLTADSPPAAYELARRARRPGEWLLVAGSVFLAAEFRKLRYEEGHASTC